MAEMDVMPSVEGQLPLSPALGEECPTTLAKEKDTRESFNTGESMQVNSFLIWKVDEMSTQVAVKRMSVDSRTDSKEKEYFKSKQPKWGRPGDSIQFKYDAFHVVLGKPELELPEDLFKNLKFYLIIGRILGIIPYSGVFSNSFTQLYFYPKSPPAIFSFCIVAVLTVNFILGFINSMLLPKHNAYEIAKSIGATVQFLWALLLYINFLLRAKKFLALFYYWAKTSVFFTKPDNHLRRDVILLTVVILTSAILENAILHLEYIPSLDYVSGRFANDTIGRNFLDTYYRRSHDHWYKMLGFHEVLAVVAFIQHKWMLYGCNYMDVTIAVFSRAMYFRFKTLNELTYENLAKPLKKGHSSKSRKIHGDAWVQMAQDHKRLCDLLQEIESYFSPLVFGSYAVNIFYICMQLLDGLTVDISTKSLVHSIYAPWSFLHIIMRIYIIYICAARINSYAHQIRTVVQECPIDQYNAEIARLDKKVTTGPDIGLTGLGCFVVTKPLILKIVSVVFTFEIVLLQGAPPSVTSGAC